jgi:hypothetical protein
MRGAVPPLLGYVFTEWFLRNECVVMARDLIKHRVIERMDKGSGFQGPYVLRSNFQKSQYVFGRHM